MWLVQLHSFRNPPQVLLADASHLEFSAQAAIVPSPFLRRLMFSGHRLAHFKDRSTSQHNMRVCRIVPPLGWASFGVPLALNHATMGTPILRKTIVFHTTKNKARWNQAESHPQDYLETYKKGTIPKHGHLETWQM